MISSGFGVNLSTDSSCNIQDDTCRDDFQLATNSSI